MSRRGFQTGLGYYKAGNYEEALQHFDVAVESGGPNGYLILDSRAAVYMKLGLKKEALRDAKKTIDVAPDRWQGYARAARVFLHTSKLDAALIMVKMALDRLKDNEDGRRTSLLAFEGEIRNAQEALERRRKRFTDHMGKLPIELFGEIGRILVEEDHTTLITLLHVCKHWRHVVESSSYLWNTLVLTKRRPKQKAKFWIEKSSGRLRELTVREGAVLSPNWPSNWLDGLQWEHLRVFKTQRWNIMPYLLSFGDPRSLDKLEELELDESHRDVTSMPTDSFFTSGSEELPLQHLTTIDIRMDVENLSSRVKGLKTLVIRQCHTFDGSWTPFLAANPLLEKLSLEMLALGPTVNIPLTFDHLTCLEITRSVPDEIYSAKMPALSILRLRNPLIHANVFVQHLVNNTTSRLTEITLQSCLFSDMTSFTSLLRLSSDLSILEVSNTTAGVTSIVESLAAHYSSPARKHILDDASLRPPILCPKLTRVNFSSCPEIQTGPVVRMIKSRLPPKSPPSDDQGCPSPQTDEVQPIQSLIIDCCPNFDATWLPKIREAVPHVSCVYTAKKTRFRASGFY